MKDVVNCIERGHKCKQLTRSHGHHVWEQWLTSSIEAVIWYNRGFYVDFEYTCMHHLEIKTSTIDINNTITKLKVHGNNKRCNYNTIYTTL